MKIKLGKRFILSTVLILLMSANLCSVADTVVSPFGESQGRIKTVSAGLIVIKENGSDKTYSREVNNDYFEDSITYKKYFFSRKTKQIAGRIESLDRYGATIYTQNGKFEIQRYKIKDIIMKVPYKG